VKANCSWLRTSLENWWSWVGSDAFDNYVLTVGVRMCKRRGVTFVLQPQGHTTSATGTQRAYLKCAFDWDFPLAQAVVVSSRWEETRRVVGVAEACANVEPARHRASAVSTLALPLPPGRPSVRQERCEKADSPWPVRLMSAGLWVTWMTMVSTTISPGRTVTGIGKRTCCKEKRQGSPWRPPPGSEGWRFVYTGSR
jgi:hypothetical protein